MAVDFDSTNGLKLTSAAIDRTPCTIVAFFKATGDQGAAFPLALVHDNGDRGSFELTISGTSGSRRVGAIAKWGFLTRQAFSSTSYDPTTWHHGAAVFPDNDHCTAYIDGVAGAQATFTLPSLGGFADRTLVALNPSTSVADLIIGGYAGCIAQVAMWDIALGDDDILDLATGVKLPSDIPDNLVLYLPLVDAATAANNEAGTDFSVYGTGLADCSDDPTPEPEPEPEEDECGSEDEADEPQTALEWPKCDLVPSNISVELEPNTVSPGRSFSGHELVNQPDAGRWVIDLQGIKVWTDERILQWRELETNLDGRNNPILIPAYEAKLSETPIVAACDSIYLPGTVRIGIKQTAGATIRNGMHFSAGERLYRLQRVFGTSGGVTSVLIKPPLREDLAADQPLEFNDPVCRCRLETDDGMAITHEHLKFSRPSVRFVEDV